jgi:SRSO17 transposase
MTPTSRLIPSGAVPTGSPASSNATSPTSTAPSNATLVIRGLISGLERKTAEPIATAANVPRKPIQFFVGTGKWDDEAVMVELRRHVREQLAGPDGVVIIDPSAFPKKGTHSCGTTT